MLSSLFPPIRPVSRRSHSALFRWSLLAGLIIVTSAYGKSPHEPIDELIPWLLQEKDGLREIPFSRVIFDATGKRVLGLDSKSVEDQKIVQRISDVLNDVLRQMNAPDSPVQSVSRINEASSHIENLLREKLDSTPGFKCDFPRTSAGRIQRSGYPDLRIVDIASQRVLYLDPKLYANGSRESSFRTFYFEPQVATSKVTEDAIHLLAGFEHDKKREGQWNFTRWDLVDLAGFKVRLKAEFQASNRDIYRPEAILASSAK